MLGAEDFLGFMKDFNKPAPYNQKLKYNMSKLEREVQEREAEEEQRLAE
jgi:hypothetical protein